MNFHPSLLSAAAALCFFPVTLFAQETRLWTNAKGEAIEGIYMNATDDSVTIRRPSDGQAFRLALADCKPEEQSYVATKKAEEREANSIDASLRGEISWRLPGWNNLAWQNNQTSELWLCNDKGEPSEKIAVFTVSYETSSKRNEFIGKYQTEGPIHLLKTGKYVIKGRFNCSVNGEDKKMEEISQPMVLPTPGKDGIRLNIVRFTLTKQISGS